MAYTYHKRLFSLSFQLILLVWLVSGCKKKSDPETEKETGTVTDRQGNVYNTVKIGDQWWMAENLKVKVYNDSTPIVEVKATQADTAWANKNIGAFCLIDERFGLHYNWFAINDLKKLAPEGWHIPNDDEWKILEMAIGMAQKEVEKTSWRGTNECEKLLQLPPQNGWPEKSVPYGNNESGFAALPGGCRLFNGSRGEVSFAAYWWSSTQKGTSEAWYRSIHYDHKTIFRYYADKNYGLTIRCVKD
jgi:uncharacterized protein (TIGR02145 family)